MAFACSSCSSISFPCWSPSVALCENSRGKLRNFELITFSLLCAQNISVIQLFAPIGASSWVTVIITNPWSSVKYYEAKSSEKPSKMNELRERIFYSGKFVRKFKYLPPFLIIHGLFSLVIFEFFEPLLILSLSFHPWKKLSHEINSERFVPLEVMKQTLNSTAI